jgi:hypothetical protein
VRVREAYWPQPDPADHRSKPECKRSAHCVGTILVRAH